MLKSCYNEAAELAKLRQVGSWILNTVAKETISAEKIIPIPLIDNNTVRIIPIQSEKEARQLLIEVRGY